MYCKKKYTATMQVVHEGLYSSFGSVIYLVVCMSFISIYCHALPFLIFSPRAVVHIQVNDVNEFSPVFKENTYRATVTEGKIYDSILQVEAIDEDCSPQYSQICNYEIVTSDVPFAIDRNGKCI